MSIQKENENIVLLSYQLINLAGITTDLVRPLLSSMRAQITKAEVQKRGCDLISKMGSDKVSSKLGEMGAIQDLISLIKSNKKDESVLIASTKALWSLCVNELNAAVATAEKGMKEVITLMETYPTNSILMEHSIQTVWSLCLEDENEDIAIDVAVPLIIDALKIHSKNKKTGSSIVNGIDCNCIMW